MKTHAIFGPPGTGKTTKLVQDVAVRKPKRLQVVSYTKAAALEIASRIGEDRRAASTLHSLAFTALGMSRAQVISERNLEEFSKETGVQFNNPLKSETEPAEGNEYLSVLSYARNSIRHYEDAYDLQGRPGTLERFRMFVDAYGSYKKHYGLFDFDDMIQRYRDALESGKMVAPRMDHLVLDEAQDLSPLQWQLFYELSEAADEVWIAGDDDQAIYEWMGADPHGMDKFANARNATVEVLGVSHRIPAKVHAFAEKIINQINKRVKKKYEPRAEEGVFFNYEGLGRYTSIIKPDTSTLFLFRDRFRLRETAKVLNHDGIPYRVDGGSSPYTNLTAQAIVAWQEFRRTHEIDSDYLRMFLPDVAAKIKRGDRPTNLEWYEAVDVRPWLLDFYHRAVENDWLMKEHPLILSTIHSAKGREADSVIYDAQLSNKVSAHVAATGNSDPEVRLAYVAATRARHELHVLGWNEVLP